MEGQVSSDCPGVIVLLRKIGADKRHLGKLGDVEPIGAFKILVARRKLCLQAVSLDGRVQFAGRNIVGIEADVSTEIAKQTDSPLRGCFIISRRPIQCKTPSAKPIRTPPRRSTERAR